MDTRSGIQKALEQQVVCQRVEIGNLQRVGHQRAGAGAPPRPHRNIVLLGPADKVHDDQEVAGEAHLDNGIQLKFQPLAVSLLLLRKLFCTAVELTVQALVQTLVRQLPEKLIHGQPLRYRVVRQVGLTQFQYDIAAPGNLYTVGQRLGDIGEQFRHLPG